MVITIKLETLNEYQPKNVSSLWESIFLDDSLPSQEEIDTTADLVKKLLPDPPILIGGCGRSGTTLLFCILSAHPHIYPIPAETCCFCPSAYGQLEKPLPFSEINLDADPDLNLFFGKCFRELLPGSHRRWCEKTPRNVLFFGKILQHLPDAKLIHIIRDGRDVILSNHPSSPLKFWVDINRWINEVKLGLRFYNHPQVLTIRYEDLVLNHQESLKKICCFLEIPLCKEIDNWHRYASYRHDPSLLGEITKLHPESIKKWERPQWQQEIHRILLSEFMKNQEAVNLLSFLGYL